MLPYTHTDSSSSIASTTKIGISPESSGIAGSCIGTDARSAMSIVTTNSAGSICPIWRLPIMRMTRMSARYRITARKNEMSIHILPSFSIAFAAGRRIIPQSPPNAKVGLYFCADLCYNIPKYRYSEG